MRDQQTKRPIIPPPLVAVALECLACQDMAELAESLAESLGGQDKRLPPWIHVSMAPAPPEDEDEDDETPVASE